MNKKMFTYDKGSFSTNLTMAETQYIIRSEKMPFKKLQNIYKTYKSKKIDVPAWIV